MQTLLLFLGFSLVMLQSAPAAEVRAPARRVVMAYTSISPQYAPAWIAKEMKIFDKHGISAELVYVRGGIEATQALVGGDVSFINAGVGAVVDATLAGADLIVLASPSVRAETILVAKKEITSPAALKGKKVAVGSLAGPAMLTLKMILKINGLNPDRDVNYIVTGPTGPRYAALNSGVVDATLLTPPFTLYAKKAGYMLFDNIAALKEIEIANASIISTRKFAQQEPAVVERVVKSIIEGLHVYKTNAPEALPVLKKYLRIQNSEELEYVYQFYSNSMVEKPYPSTKSVQLFLDWSKHPRAKTADPKHFIDAGFVGKLDRQGFIDSLYK
jgi:ABC-type nitrate/sulfonate/bicarbonate transport system substrate-binding protein